MSDLLKIAADLVNNYFEGKTDKGGHPYTEHLCYVSNNCSNDRSKLIGMLHDIIEDTDISESQLTTLFGQDITDAIKIVSRKDNETYGEYIDRVIASGNLDAMEVKYNDLDNNMDLRRIPHPTDKDYSRVEKYKKAHKKIEQASIKLLNKKLKVCPFCGGDEREICRETCDGFLTFYIYCDGCNASTGYYETPFRAFSKWNNRITE